jgi:hypothetical protein
MKLSIDLTEADIKTAIQHYVCKNYGYDIEKAGAVRLDISPGCSDPREQQAASVTATVSIVNA